MEEFFCRSGEKKCRKRLAAFLHRKGFPKWLLSVVMHTQWLRRKYLRIKEESPENAEILKAPISVVLRMAGFGRNAGKNKDWTSQTSSTCGSGRK
jgi:hypothetical protein